VEEVRVSDPAFVHEVYDASYRRLVVQLTALCGDQREAEDAVQEAFVKALSSSSRFNDVHNPEAWLRTVALNHLRSDWRRSGILRRILPKVPGTVHVVELSDDHVALMQALRLLPEELREVVVLHHLADLTVADVAETLDRAEGTVKAQLVRGRAMLAHHLGEETGAQA